MDSTRQLKVSKLIQKELALVFQKNGQKWFNIPFITVSTVRISPDLMNARVYLTFMNQTNPEELVERISYNSKEIRTILAGKIRHQVRKIPELQFFYDDSMDYAERMDQLFEKLKSKKKGKAE